MMNSALRETIMPGNAPVTVETLRKIIREELHAN